MCDGNLRSTIKALIMANEYLESELLELQVAVACGCAPAGLSNSDARLIDPNQGRQGARREPRQWPM